jgi:hypothetical protein
MPLISIPKALSAKLGEEATEALIEVLKDTYQSQREELFTQLEDRFYRKVELEIHTLSDKIDQKFGEVQKQFGEIQKQIAAQTRWMIGLIGFLAIALKTLDLIFK